MPTATDTNSAGDFQTMFSKFEEKMLKEKIGKGVIEAFKYYYKQLTEGGTGYIPSEGALPVDPLLKLTNLEKYREKGTENLSKTLSIKLNGGLGTSMGLSRPKSLIEAKNGYTFLEIVIKQSIAQDEEYRIKSPLVLMNSFNTEKQTQEALEKVRIPKQNLPISFIENKFPKINAETLEPIKWPKNPKLEWAPPGHGDVYQALYGTGMLNKMLQKGFEYALISNIDNLNARIDPRIVGYMVSKKIPFLMEAAPRWETDKKGGHLALGKHGGLFLREVAQCSPEEIDIFQDYKKYCYFNTNNIWIHLPALKNKLDENNGFMKLPLIRNEKHVDPKDKTSPKVYQLETAMGSAISTFEGSKAIEIRRRRHRSIKKNGDLLLLWSDAYLLSAKFTLEKNRDSSLKSPTVINLDPKFYGTFDNLKERFPQGAPSLRKCASFTVKGNVFFGKNVVAEGNVTVENTGSEPMYIEDGTSFKG